MGEILHIVSVSGGKDSTALYLWAIEQFGRDGFFAVFADTGHEHPVTYNYVRNLPAMASGPEVTWVRADFRDRLKTRFNTVKQRSEQAQGMLDRNRDAVEKNGWTTGNTFLDLIIWKGRVPSTKAQFCTEHLKLFPIRELIESIRGDREVRNYVGIRAGESERRSKMEEKSYDKFFDCDVYRPLLHWNEKQVFAYLKKFNVEPNPLYAAGFTRVGCFPCIHSRKGELARLPESVWGKLSEWEKIVGRSWFPPGLVPGIVIPSVEDARKWSTTVRGGRIQDMFPPDVADIPSCMSTWGSCE